MTGPPRHLSRPPNDCGVRQSHVPSHCGRSRKLVSFSHSVAVHNRVAGPMYMPQSAPLTFRWVARTPQVGSFRVSDASCVHSGSTTAIRSDARVAGSLRPDLVFKRSRESAAALAGASNVINAHLKSRIDGCRKTQEPSHRRWGPTAAASLRSSFLWPRNDSRSMSMCQAHTAPRSINTSQPSKAPGSCDHHSNARIPEVTDITANLQFPQETVGHCLLQDRYPPELPASHRAIGAS